MTNVEILSKINQLISSADTWQATERQPEVKTSEIVSKYVQMFRNGDIKPSELGKDYHPDLYLASIIYQLENDIKAEEVSKKHNGSFKTRMVKLAKLASSNKTSFVDYAWREDIDCLAENCVCCGNGYIAFALAFDVPFEVKDSADHPNLNRIYQGVYDNLSNDAIPLDAADIKAQYKIYKSIPKESRPSRKIIKLGTQYFNLEFIVSICDILGGDELYLDNNKNVLGGAFIHNGCDSNEPATAVIMPVHPNSLKEDER